MYTVWDKRTSHAALNYGPRGSVYILYLLISRHYWNFSGLLDSFVQMFSMEEHQICPMRKRIYILKMYGWWLVMCDWWPWVTGHLVSSEYAVLSPS